MSKRTQQPRGYGTVCTLSTLLARHTISALTSRSSNWVPVRSYNRKSLESLVMRWKLNEWGCCSGEGTLREVAYLGWSLRCDLGELEPIRWAACCSGRAAELAVAGSSTRDEDGVASFRSVLFVLLPGNATLNQWSPSGFFEWLDGHESPTNCCVF